MPLRRGLAAAAVCALPLSLSLSLLATLPSSGAPAPEQRAAEPSSSLLRELLTVTLDPFVRSMVRRLGYRRVVT